MKSTILLILMTISISCDNDNKNDAVVIDTAIDMTLKNEKGDDLLDPNITGTYNTDKIKIYYVDYQGNSHEYYEKNLDSPKGFLIFKNQNEYMIRIFPKIDLSISNPKTIIKWNENESDEIKCEIQKISSNEICTKVWINNSLMYSDYSKPRIINLIK